MSKREKRQQKKARMAAMYRAFWARPEVIAAAKAIHFDWCIPLHPRLVRDTLLGSGAVGKSENQP